MSVDLSLQVVAYGRSPTVFAELLQALDRNAPNPASTMMIEGLRANMLKRPQQGWCHDQVSWG